MALFWFCAKVGILLFVFIWIRGTLPRFRYDQLMRFAWTFLFPLAMLNLLVTSLLVALSQPNKYGLRIVLLHLRDRRGGLRRSTWWCRRTRSRARFRSSA